MLIRNPTALEGKYVDYPCLAAYGGPVDPNTVVGGFEGTDSSSERDIVDPGAIFLILYVTFCPVILALVLL